MKTSLFDTRSDLPYSEQLKLAMKRLCAEHIKRRRITEGIEWLNKASEASGDTTARPEYRANGPVDCDRGHTPEFSLSRGAAHYDFLED